MATLVRIEPALFNPETEGWYVFSDGRKYLRALNPPEPVRASSDFPCPRIARDSIEPCRGMDGQMYDSLSGYRRTLKPEGNPQGERYTEIGNEEIHYQPPQFDEAARREDIRHALMDIKYDRVPPPSQTGMTTND